MPKTQAWKPAQEELEDVREWFDGIWMHNKPDFSRQAFDDWRTARDLTKGLT